MAVFMFVAETAQESRNPVLNDVTVELTENKEVRVIPKNGSPMLLKDVQLVSMENTQMTITGTDKETGTLKYYVFKHQELSKQPGYDKLNNLPKTDPIKALNMI